MVYLPAQGRDSWEQDQQAIVVDGLDSNAGPHEDVLAAAGSLQQVACALWPSVVLCPDEMAMVIKLWRRGAYKGGRTEPPHLGTSKQTPLRATRKPC